MKFWVRRNILIHFFNFSAILLVILPISCKKAPTPTPVINRSDFNLRVDIDGLEMELKETIIQSPKKTATASSRVLNTEAAPNKTSSGIFGELEIQTEIGALNSTRPKKVSVKQSNGNIESSGRDVRTFQAMEKGKTFIFVLYQLDEHDQITDYFSQGAGVVGEELYLPVNMNSRYRWFSYSFNSGQQLAKFDPQNPVVPVKASLRNTGQDFLYATGIIKTSNVLNGETDLKIRYLRKTALINVSLNARGMFSALTSASMTIQKHAEGLKNGLFSITSGKYLKVEAASDLKISQWRPITGSQIPKDWVWQQQVQTVPSASSTKLTLAIDYINLQSSRINGQSPNSSSLVNRKFEHLKISFKSIHAQEGKSYLANLQLIESAITLGGTSWARGNLNYVAGSSGNEYRIRYDNPYIENRAGGIMNLADTDYWKMGLTPYEETGGLVKDPCHLIYPQGKWRLPSASDFRGLISAGNPIMQRIVHPNRGGWYLSLQGASKQNMGHPNGNLIFQIYGYRQNQSLLFINIRNIHDFNYVAGNTFQFGRFSITGDVGYYRTNENNNYFILSFRTLLFDQLQAGIFRNHAIQSGLIRCVRR